MLVYEYKLSGSKKHYAAIDEAIRIVQFVRNKCLRLWMDNVGTSKNDICRAIVGRRPTVLFLQKNILRADGYYCQFCVDTERTVEHVASGRQAGIDVGLKAYLTDSEGATVENPRHYRKAEKKLALLQRRLSRKKKKSANRKKARKALAKQHLKVQRQREDFARKVANTYVSSHDLIAYEDLQIKHMVRNRKLSKSIHDAGWGTFLQWVKRSGALHDIAVVAVAPHSTSQNCSACGTTVKKSLSVRTHICTGCGMVLDRDHNAALNILDKALGTVGHTGTSKPASLQNASGNLASTASSKRRSGKSSR